MPFAFAALAFGLVLTISGLKGVSIPDVLLGKWGEPLDPGGKAKDISWNELSAGSAGGNETNTVPASSFSPGGSGGRFKGPNAALLNHLAQKARSFGLSVNEVCATSGHTGGSLHYACRAFDSGGPADKMAAYYRYARPLIIRAGSPAELFYDPIGGVDSGKDIGAIGGHDKHVHTGA